MRIRGRRVVLLFAGALPLLANETGTVAGLIADISVGDTALSQDATPVVVRLPQHEVLDDDAPIHLDENDENHASYTAAEAIHNEEFKLPLLPKQRGEILIDPPSDKVEPKGVTIVEMEQHKTKNSKVVDDEPPVKEQNEELKKTDPDAATERVAVSNGGDDPVIKSSDDIVLGVDANNSLAETSGKSLRNKTLEEKGETKTSRPENKDASSTTELGTAEDEKNVPEASEKEETADEKSLGSDSTQDEDEDEEDSLFRVSVDYASKSAGAQIIEKSNSFKGTSNLLNADKDKYAIAPCDEKKFVVVSLSEDILVKQIRLANYERFSSTVKDFQVMGSQTLEKWVDLGTYSASPGNGEQTFDLKEAVWARYLKFKFISHHGVEYYCTVSQIKVHGSTMVQGFHEQWEESEDEEIAEVDIGDIVDSGVVVENQGGTPSAKDGALDDSNTTADETTTGTPTAENALNGEPLMIEEETKDTKTRSKETVASYIGGCRATSTCLLLSSRELDEKLNGALTDEELFSNLYDLIPSTLNALPKTSRESPGRQTSSGELRTFHQIGSLAMQSIYSTSKMASDAATSLISNSSDIITTPKMTDGVGSVIRQYIRAELGLLANLWDSYAVDEPKVTVSVDDEEIMLNQTEQQDNATSNLAAGRNVTFERDTTKNATASAKEAEESEPVQTNKTSATKPTDNHKNDALQISEVPSKPSVDPPMDVSLAKMLEKLPSAECLSKLDFSQFKAKLAASKKLQNGSGGSSSSGSSPMEPIFKKLTDEIKLLQSSIIVHDQFTKTAVACYQRVLLDMIVETEMLRTDHEERLRNLEKNLQASWTRSIVGNLRTASSWIYSVVVYVFSPLLTWLSALLRVTLRIPDSLYRFILHRWPAIKNILIANGGAGSSNLSEFLRPFTDQLDQLLVDMKIADSSHRPEDSDEEMWRFPVLPIVLVILLGRLVMCCASPSSTTLSSKREFIMLKAKALSPSRIRSFSSTKKVPSSSSSGEKKRLLTVEGRNCKAKASQNQCDTPPPVVSEPAHTDDPEPSRVGPSPKDKDTRHAQYRSQEGENNEARGSSPTKLSSEQKGDSPPPLISEEAVLANDPRSHS